MYNYINHQRREADTVEPAFFIATNYNNKTPIDNNNNNNNGNN